MRAPRFDNSVSTGTVVQLFATLITLLGMAWTLSGRLTAIETKLDPLWQQYNRVREMQGPMPVHFTQEK